MPKNYTKKVTKRMRPEFRKLAKDMTCESLAEFLGATVSNVWAMRARGYLSGKYADRAEERSGGDYKARLLMKR